MAFFHLSSPGPRQPCDVPAACVTGVLSEEGVLAGKSCRAELLAACSAEDEQLGLCPLPAHGVACCCLAQVRCWHCPGCAPGAPVSVLFKNQLGFLLFKFGKMSKLFGAGGSCSICRETHEKNHKASAMNCGNQIVLKMWDLNSCYLPASTSSTSRNLSHKPIGFHVNEDFLILC